MNGGIPTSKSIDLFLKYKNENRLTSPSTIVECFKYFDKNNDQTLDLNEFELFFSKLFSHNNVPYQIAKIKIKSIFIYFNSNKTLSRKAALIVVDVQNDFIDGSLALKNCPAKQDGGEVIPFINSLIETVPFDVIVYTQDWHPKDHCSFVNNVHLRQLSKSSPTKENAKLHDIVIFEDYPNIEQKLWPAHCIQNTQGAELHQKLIVVDESTDKMKRHVLKVHKGSRPDIDSYSAFFDNCKLNETSLDSDLKKYGITDLYICGLAGDVCVAATAFDGIDLNYRVAYINDACRVIDVEDSENTKKKLASRGAIIINSNDVSDLVSGKDRRPEFALSMLKL